MALFGPSKRTPLQRLRASDWKDEAERAELLGHVAQQGAPATELLFLLSHADAACRDGGAEMLLRGARPGLFEQLVEEAEGKTEAQRKGIFKVALALPAREVIPVLERYIGERSP